MNEPSLEEKLAALQARLDVLEAARPVRSRRGWAKLIIAGSVVIAATASAQLVTFLPNEPASAAAVNGNFTQLKTWLESKVGLVANAGVTTASVTTSGAVQAQSVTTATTTTNSLVVTAGLPITIETDFIRNLSNDAVEQVHNIAPDTGRRVCFLAGFELHDGFTNGTQALCQVERNGAAGWQLRLDVDTGTAIAGSSGDVDVLCRVRCITW